MICWKSLFEKEQAQRGEATAQVHWLNCKVGGFYARLKYLWVYRLSRLINFADNAITKSKRQVFLC